MQNWYFIRLAKKKKKAAYSDTLESHFIFFIVFLTYFLFSQKCTHAIYEKYNLYKKIIFKQYK